MNKSEQTTVTQRIELQPDNVRNGLGKLVLILLKLIHELLERQAVKRMEDGSLTPAQIEQLGMTLMQQSEEINKLLKLLNLTEKDLNLNLGLLGKLF